MNHAFSPDILFNKRALRLLERMPHDLQNVGTWSWHYRLIADVGTDNPFAVGTAFPIGENILVTAKHIFGETMEAKENAEICRSLYAVQAVAENRFIMHRIDRILAHKTADLMLLYVCIESSRHYAALWVPSWKMRRTAPHKGEMVMAIGYVEGRLRIESKNSDGGILEVSDEGRLNFGTVRAVHKKSRDKVMLPCPCFEVGAEFSPGMSGGPVFDKNGRLCGVISTGIEGAASSFAVTLWPSLSDLYGNSIYISSSGELCWRRTN